MVDIADKEGAESTVEFEPAVEECTHEVHAVGFDVPDMPARVWVDAEVSLTFRAACACGCDLTGGRLTVSDTEGAPVADVRLLTPVDGVCLSEPVTITMPHDPGEYVWHVLYTPYRPTEEAEPAAEAESEDAARLVVHEAAPFELVLSPEAHVTSMSVWDVPSPVVAGSSALISVGVTCPAGCDLSGQEVAVLDETGAEVSRGRLSGRAGATGNLWCAEVAVAMPEACGSHEWKARYEGADGIHPTSERRFSFAVVEDVPTCPVTVRVASILGEEGPLGRAHVTVREPGKPPYRGLTGDDGTCVVCVPVGTYNVSAACTGYKSATWEGVEVGEEGSDVELRLNVEPGF